MILLLSAGLCLLGFLIYFAFREDDCGLPGPIGFPIVGFRPFLGKEPHRMFSELTEKFGQMFQLRIGSRRVVVLNSLDLIQEAFSKWEFCDRPDMLSFQTMQEVNKVGIVFFSVDDKWKFIRKSAVRALSLLLSSSKSRLQTLTLTAVNYLERKFSHWPEDGKYPYEEAFKAVNSTIGSLSYAQVFEPEDPFLDQIWRESASVPGLFSIGAFADYFPSLRFFKFGVMNWFKARTRDQSQYIHKLIEKHCHSGEIRDIQDALELTVQSETQRRKWEALGFKETEVRFASRDLFFAGTFTLLEHLLFALRICALFPDTQKELREHIIEVCPEGDVSLEHEERMPYVLAFLEELFRFASHVPLSIAHAVSADVRFRGFRIPKGTVVFANFWHIHHDPQLFPDPFQFRPQRFLDVNGQFDSKLTKFVKPFGVGKRRCVGERLARKELFLLVTNLVRRLEVGLKWVEGEGLFDHPPGFVLEWLPAGFIFKPVAGSGQRRPKD